MLSSHQFWMGVFAGLVLTYLWHKYQIKKMGG